ncbi:GNAT family N-acetyltransferase [Salinilacihabitans rarus]|uniref:GNAT family N-acetyltransferase n=1 Tax=Salinilacihabitans rarus TaxID=2961596 RepID=UPI0020C9079B|nr:GNAT family N-acetyltransferase [Salinilacihabitans rarus]
MSKPSIRQASVEDAERLAAVYRNAYRENRRLGFPAKAESVTAGTVAEWIRTAHVLVATVRGEIVGGVRLQATDSDTVKLSRLGVHEEWKSQGIGSELMDFAEEWARDAGYAIVWLTTPEDHPHLPGFYRDRGYETTGHYPLEYRDYDEITMEKHVR